MSLNAIARLLATDQAFAQQQDSDTASQAFMAHAREELELIIDI